MINFEFWFKFLSREEPFVNIEKFLPHRALLQFVSLFMKADMGSSRPSNLPLFRDMVRWIRENFGIDTRW